MRSPDNWNAVLGLTSIVAGPASILVLLLGVIWCSPTAIRIGATGVVIAPAAFLVCRVVDEIIARTRRKVDG